MEVGMWVGWGGMGGITECAIMPRKWRRRRRGPFSLLKRRMGEGGGGYTRGYGRSPYPCWSLGGGVDRVGPCLPASLPASLLSSGIREGEQNTAHSLAEGTLRSVVYPSLPVCAATSYELHHSTTPPLHYTTQTHAQTCSYPPPPLPL